MKIQAIDSATLSSFFSFMHAHALKINLDACWWLGPGKRLEAVTRRSKQPRQGSSLWTHELGPAVELAKSQSLQCLLFCFEGL